jgi:hypothetical protein
LAYALYQERANAPRMKRFMSMIENSRESRA